ncbi:MAG TPA: hypothetical protein VII06_34825 [Chloroflexota bacterium]|jgi:hypothetical protein
MVQTQADGQIASDTPGRLRVRLRRTPGRPASLERIQQHLADQSGISAVESRWGTGNLVVYYNPRTLSREALLDILHDIGVLLHGVASGESLAPDDGPPAVAGGHSETADSIIGALDDLDRYLLRLTGQRFDLRLLFPVTLGALGLGQWVRCGLGLAQVPAYLLLWLAFDAFYKLHRDPAGRAREAR